MSELYLLDHRKMKKITVIKNLQIPDILLNELNLKSSQIIGFLDDKRLIFDNWFSKIIERKIESFDSWVNYINYRPNLINGYEWHNEKGVGGAASTMQGDWAGIIWIRGDTNCGGNLSLLVDDNIEEIQFEVNTAIVMPATMFHRVEHYYGNTSRVSLNFTFDVI